MKNLGTTKFINRYFDIVDKQGNTIPFQLNPIQQKYLQEDYTGSDIILKARQQGFSSVILGLFTKRFLTVQNTYNVVVADNADNAEGLLSRVKFFINSFCEKNGGHPEDILKYNSKYHLYFEGMNSTYIIGTAENKEVGRSKTITNLHLSEGAFYPDLEKILASVVQAVVPNGTKIIETTANGFNLFKDYWEKTKRGETPFKAHFYPANAFYSQEVLQQKEKELGRLYKQEYPDKDIEAFISSSESYFDSEALEYYINQVKEPNV